MFRPLVLSAFLLSALSVGSIAEAQKKGQAKVSSGNAAALHSALGDLKWGMTKKEVLDHFTKAIREKYRKPLAKAPDAIEADRLRHEMNEAIRKIHESVTSFDGETTGWDVSFLKGEFTHHNGEEMLVVRDENSQNFYFFIDGKLWKWYKAFDAKVFAGQPFEGFASALQARFGDATEREGQIDGRGPDKRWLEWQTKKVRARAIDENQFYGFYCLVFESRAVLAKLPLLRKVAPKNNDKGHALVDAVTADDAPATEANSDIVDRVTGKIRNRKDAPEKKKK